MATERPTEVATEWRTAAPTEAPTEVATDGPPAAPIEAPRKGPQVQRARKGAPARQAALRQTSSKQATSRQATLRQATSQHTTARLAWVTGASSGIGLAVAQRLLAQGWSVLGLDRAAASSEISQGASARYAHLKGDLGDLPKLRKRLAKCETPHAVVHAAGIMHTAPAGQLDSAAGEAMWCVHVAVACELANCVLPPWLASGQGGRMVLVGSRVSHGMAGRSQYAASKAALVALARSWAAEGVASGVTVNVVSPAATDTPMLRGGSRASSTPRLPPMGRLIQPGEVADLVLYLLGDSAAAITGQDIAICGGASLPK
jgi:3-oxoacyl-[acyl-carrier protein] reductase